MANVYDPLLSFEMLISVANAEKEGEKTEHKKKRWHSSKKLFKIVVHLKSILHGLHRIRR